MPADQEDAMPILLMRARLALPVLAAAMLAVPAASAPLAAAGTRQVSVESLIYDLKHPDALRRQAAARELGAVKYKPRRRNSSRWPAIQSLPSAAKSS